MYQFYGPKPWNWSEIIYTIVMETNQSWAPVNSYETKAASLQHVYMPLNSQAYYVANHNDFTLCKGYTQKIYARITSPVHYLCEPDGTAAE